MAIPRDTRNTILRSAVNLALDENYDLDLVPVSIPMIARRCSILSTISGDMVRQVCRRKNRGITNGVLNNYVLVSQSTGAQLYHKLH